MSEGQRERERGRMGVRGIGNSHFLTPRSWKQYSRAGRSIVLVQNVKRGSL